eukprot:COSAG01_NODE_6391_length_3697_cov_6.264314_3_plen_64_part_00
MRGGAPGWSAQQVPGVRRPSCDGAVGQRVLLHARIDATATVNAVAVAAVSSPLKVGLLSAVRT